MKNIIALGLVSIIVFSSYKEKSEATLTLEIKNFDPDLLKIWDAFGAKNWRDYFKKLGETSVITLPIDRPCIRYFTYGSHYKRTFLYPGQSLKISIDDKDSGNTLSFGGSLAMENVILDSVTNRIGYVNYTYLYAQRLDIALSKIDSGMTANIQYFEKIAKGKQTIPAFIESIKVSILYSAATQKLNVLKKQKHDNNSKYYAFLNKINIENPNFLDIPDYQWFLSSYVSMEADKSFEQLDSINKRSPDAHFEESLKVIINLKNHSIKEFLLATKINDRLQETGVKDFDRHYDYFKKFNKNPRYSELIRKEYERRQLLAPGKPAPSFTLNDVDGNPVSLSDFKGKYVFIDFWQTLCPRSARELPHYLKLYADYKDENIAFVSISVNEDENVWREYVKANKNVGTSLRSEKYFDSKEYNEYQVPGLPFFVILDKEGKIIDPAAAKPSSKEIRETLDKLLKSK